MNFAEVMTTNPPRLVVLFRRGEDGSEEFQWGVVGTVPVLTLIGAIVRVQAELAFRSPEPCEPSALVIAWDAESRKVQWFVHQRYRWTRSLVCWGPSVDALRLPSLTFYQERSNLPMADELNRDYSGEFRSPGGFVFGVQGWTWGEQRPSAITFFLDGTCKVSDQHGRPIKGVVKDNKPIYFDRCTHAQVVTALAEERVDWKVLTCAGWPQLPYEQLKALRILPSWPFTEKHTGDKCQCIRCCIPDPVLRKDSLRIRREVDSAREKEMVEVDE